MSLDHFLAMLGFSFAMSATPGPNIVLLVASGMNHGVARTLPHMLGIPLGLGALLLAVGAGLGALFLAVPGVQTALKFASVAYMLYLAWTIATAAPSAGDAEGRQSERSRPMTLIEGALFQWVNPKAWAMALGAVSAYTLPTAFGASLAILVATMMGISIPISLAWTGLGVALRRVLSNPTAHRAFNVAMAALLLLSLWPIVSGLQG